MTWHPVIPYTPPPALPWVTTEAVCAQYQPDLWFPHNGVVKQARALCRTCPLLDPCLAYALAHPELDGVWGATTPKERQALRRELGLRQQRILPIRHGSSGGAKQHRRRGEAVCERCRIAEAAASARRKAAKR